MEIRASTLAIMLALAGCTPAPERCRRAYEKRQLYDRGVCRKGCDVDGDAYSCDKTAVAMVLGHGGAKDLDAALAYSRKACALDPKHCHSVRFNECIADPGLCEKRCLAGAADACTWQARATATGLYRAPIDHRQSDLFFRRACELDPGTCKEGAQGCGLDANACLRRCDEGDAGSCFWMSALFKIGDKSILRDPKRARELMARACSLKPGLFAGCTGMSGSTLPAEGPGERAR